MRQVAQAVHPGRTEVREVPEPVLGDASVLVDVAYSLLSAGTERAVVQLSERSLLGKMRARPDHVRRVVAKARAEGLRRTAVQLRAKLAEPMPLGYAAAGLVRACGPRVSGLRPGDPVAVAAPHAGVVAVGERLCARVPAGVALEDAAYAAVAAVALQGVRLARLQLGERVLVVGLGLVGLLTVALCRAQGALVYGVDVDPRKLARARRLGADAVAQGGDAEAVVAWADGHGVDACLVATATASERPLALAAAACCVRGRIVLLGTAGMRLPRAPLFEKELQVCVSHSLGPGRGDPTYEVLGRDYPYGQVRWTAQRNMEATLQAMARGLLPVRLLTTHRFAMAAAPRAYAVVARPDAGAVGVVLRHAGGHDGHVGPSPRLIGAAAGASASTETRADRAGTARRAAHRALARIGARAPLGLGVIGAGNYTRLVLVPLLGGMRGVHLRGIASAHGLRAAALAGPQGFAFAARSGAEVLACPATRAVVVTTQHHDHAAWTIAALRAGRHVLVEKPLCIAAEQLAEIAGCVATLGARCPVLMVGLNRRFAPAVRALRDAFADVHAPLTILYRFAVPELPAAAWPHCPERGGGRLVGEACHAIDTCVALCGSAPVRVYAAAAGAAGPGPTDDRASIALQHADGSLSTIVYRAGGDPAAPRERIEVAGGGLTGCCEDFRRVEIYRDGRRRRLAGRGDKGHAALLQHFVAACRGAIAQPVPWAEQEAVAWAGLAARTSLATGTAVVRAGEPHLG